MHHSPIKINRDIRAKTLERCRARKIVIPTFRQLRNPDSIPEVIQQRLQSVGLWDIDPLNLFRITWKNDVVTGGFGGVNYFELPSALTGVKARIIGIIGKYFPTGAHKVGAAFGCLVPRLVSGNFDPDHHRAVWPSTGNYCRGGAFDCALLGCTSVAILPEEMSAERFEWLRSIGAEVIATPGCESNVKEIYDKCAELRADSLNVILNQFDEFGNPMFHYNVTGPALAEIADQLQSCKPAIYVSATGSAGTIAAGDYLKTRYPNLKVVATEAQQCPTLYMNGYGGHRIEGIGDKHIPWVHNTRNTDAVAAIDDEDCMRLLRLFNEPRGHEYLREQGIEAAVIEQLSLLGISGVCNLLASIKAAKYFELSAQDIIFTVFTDSAEMYQSRLLEQTQQHGEFTRDTALVNMQALLGQRFDYFKELTYYDRKAIHHLKYYTWVEQQGKSYDEINEQWDPEYWRIRFEDDAIEVDRLIEEFNHDVGVIH